MPQSGSLLACLSDTKQALLIALKDNQPATIATLTNQMGISTQAVSIQIKNLIEDRLVEKTSDRQKNDGHSGRPAELFRLTDLGEHLFPKLYANLLAEVFQVINQQSPEARQSIINGLIDLKSKAMAARMRGLPLADRVAALTDFYFEHDPFMELTADPKGWRLIEHNCPYLATARRDPTVCHITIGAMAKLLGVPVIHECDIVARPNGCIFRIPAPPGIDPLAAKPPA